MNGSQTEEEKKVTTPRNSGGSGVGGDRGGEFGYSDPMFSDSSSDSSVSSGDSTFNSSDDEFLCSTEEYEEEEPAEPYRSPLTRPFYNANYWDNFYTNLQTRNEAVISDLPSMFCEEGGSLAADKGNVEGEPAVGSCSGGTSQGRDPSPPRRRLFERPMANPQGKRLGRAYWATRKLPVDAAPGGRAEVLHEGQQLYNRGYRRPRVRAPTGEEAEHEDERNGYPNKRRRFH